MDDKLRMIRTMFWDALECSGDSSDNREYFGDTSSIFFEVDVNNLGDFANSLKYFGVDLKKLRFGECVTQLRNYERDEISSQLEFDLYKGRIYITLSWLLIGPSSPVNYSVLEKSCRIENDNSVDQKRGFRIVGDLIVRGHIPYDVDYSKYEKLSALIKC